MKSYIFIIKQWIHNSHKNAFVNNNQTKIIIQNESMFHIYLTNLFCNKNVKRVKKPETIAISHSKHSKTIRSMSNNSIVGLMLIDPIHDASDQLMRLCALRVKKPGKWINISQQTTFSILNIDKQQNILIQFYYLQATWTTTTTTKIINCNRNGYFNQILIWMFCDICRMDNTLFSFGRAQIAFASFLVPHFPQHTIQRNRTKQ